MVSRKHKEQFNNLCHIHNKVRDYEVDRIRERVCVNDLPLKEFKGKHYCLFHLPTKDKDVQKFEETFKARLKAVEDKIEEIEKLSEGMQIAAKNKLRYDFRYVWFPSLVDLRDYRFRALTSFSSATFSAKVDFYKALFEEKSPLFFRQTSLQEAVSFNYANFDGYVSFQGSNDNRLFGEKAMLDLQHARIDDPKKISFHTVRLEPSWFINTNATGFVFSDCEWRYSDGKRLSVKTELENLEKRGFENPNALLMYACWHLADNYEESKSFRKASLFRQMANESRRLETSWYWQPFTLRWWYWLSSFYGESSSWATLVLVTLIFLVFPIIYTQTNFQTCSKDRPIATSLTICESKDEEVRKKCTCSKDQITFTDAIVQSLTTATLQNVEYRKPLTVWGELLIILEKIFAPLQAALLALAIRRKFMR